ncbi:MAG: RNA-binding domain-containing protein [Halobacteriota archaeon]
MDDGVAYHVEVTAKAPVYATESEERVEEALLNLFPRAEVERRSSSVDVLPPRLVASTRSVERLTELVERFELGPSFHDHLIDRIEMGVLSFSLKKQAAYVGRPSFDVGGHELGSIDVRMESDDLEAVVDRVAGVG